mmetsp:Transcript_13588/g.32181  ORF Transcript_13588/g.32181 Transcript_13588/m.32181 type:complete len:128 (+) Transcript_13588:109-492(+)
MRWKSTGLFVGNALRYVYPKHLPSLHLSRDKKSSMTTEHGNANNEEEIGHTECLIIGAGVVGCAVSRALALQGREVLMLDMHNSLGFETSSRNSEGASLRRRATQALRLLRSKQRPVPEAWQADSCY